MSRRLIVGHLLKSAPIAAALLISPAAHAVSVQAVFAAENALYGAGYTIGQADGWIDEQLRNAVKQYQADHSGLTSTGELDAKTLEALGISARSSQVVGGNAVASRAAALSELGLSEDRYQQSWTKVAEKPPEPKPKPAPEPAVVSAPEPEIEKAPEPDSQPVEIIASDEQTSQPEPKVVAAEPVTKTKPEPEPVQSKAKVASVDPSPVPEQQPDVSAEAEPDSEPVKITSSFGFSDNSETGIAEVEVESEAPQADVDATLAGNSAEIEDALPQEPTAAGVASNAESAAASEEPESSGNVLTRVFDFLFGWMV
ncbi:peptidoglycan-binding protein [Marinobacter sp. CHS3-4]|uniref:peptidoglycan-binding protein n=1 Tax=Marinobacter sp. CHS3-4 TaxID=3045174 RepID=UPI0024B58B9A|nr:peptidoglycan-binding protein [Marinobacter sp. CHS3-4]MDI9245312.1 peptidoglycan-binding protein [Marinobacter sp. CHS3-4]